MANVLNRTTKKYLKSVNTPEFPTQDWIHNPDVNALINALVPARHWKITGDTVSEMSPAEKASVDEAVPRLEMVSDAVVVDGIPTVDADGDSVHTITLRKRDRGNKIMNSGTETIELTPSIDVELSNPLPVLVSGTGQIKVGPATNGGELTLKARDQAGGLVPAEIALRFRGVMAQKKFLVKEHSGKQVSKEVWYTTDNGDGTYAGKVEEKEYVYSGSKLSQMIVRRFNPSGTEVSSKTYGMYTNGSDTIQKPE